MRRSLLYAKLFRGGSVLAVFMLGVVVGRGESLIVVGFFLFESLLFVTTSGSWRARYNEELRIDESKIEVLPLKVHY
jgi:hypothetical protein